MLKSALIILVASANVPDYSYPDFLKMPERERSVLIDGFLMALGKYGDPDFAQCANDAFYGRDGKQEFFDVVENLNQNPAGPLEPDHQLLSALKGFITSHCSKTFKMPWNFSK
jgi:hypothetical protein